MLGELYAYQKNVFHSTVGSPNQAPWIPPWPWLVGWTGTGVSKPQWDARLFCLTLCSNRPRCKSYQGTQHTFKVMPLWWSHNGVPIDQLHPAYTLELSKEGEQFRNLKFLFFFFPLKVPVVKRPWRDLSWPSVTWSSLGSAGQLGFSPLPQILIVHIGSMKDENQRDARNYQLLYENLSPERQLK